MKTLWRALASAIVLFSVGPAEAQVSIAGYNVTADSQERLGEDHVVLTGSVELERTSDQSKLYAERVEFFEKEERAIATGNVVYTQGRNTIGADRADLNTRTRYGTFYSATGVANVQPQRQAPSRTIAAPQMAGQETDVYFFGDVVEKIGPKKYRITNGGFSTCVQPTPRWDLTADTIILNIDHYTFLRQALLKVKGVPMLYLPVMWYPTKEEGRATGFLIPTYGSSTIRGQAISNAFFWAIDRSQDATFMYDWMSTAGNGVGSEYRYNLGSGDGNIKAYMLSQRPGTTTNSDGSLSQVSNRSYEFRGNMNQQFAHNLRARGKVDYFSSLEVAQTFNMNIYDASRNQRTYGGNLIGAWRNYSLNATFDRSETYYDRYSSVVTGNAPRVTFTRNERPIAGSPLYFSLGTEFVQFARATRQVDPNANTELVTDTGLGRFDCRTPDPLPVQEVPVVHRQHLPELAQHLLHAQSGRSGRARRGRPGAG